MTSAGISAQSQSEDTQSEMQSMKVKLQKAKRTLDNMKKREAEAVAAKAQAEARAAELEARLSQASAQVTLLASLTFSGRPGGTLGIPSQICALKHWSRRSQDKGQNVVTLSVPVHFREIPDIHLFCM